MSASPPITPGNEASKPQNDITKRPDIQQLVAKSKLLAALDAQFSYKAQGNNLNVLGKTRGSTQDAGTSTIKSRDNNSHSRPSGPQDNRGILNLVLPPSLTEKWINPPLRTPFTSTTNAPATPSSVSLSIVSGAMLSSDTFDPAPKEQTLPPSKADPRPTISRVQTKRPYTKTSSSTKVQINYPLYTYRDKALSAPHPIPVRKYIRDEDDANNYVGGLDISGALGFDLEWRVIFGSRDPPRPTAVLQICDRKSILVIQLSALKGRFPCKLKEVLEDPQIPKLGVNILNDGIRLANDFGVRPQALVELGGLARQADPGPKGYLEKYFRVTNPGYVEEYLTSLDKDKPGQVTAGSSETTDKDTSESLARKAPTPDVTAEDKRRVPRKPGAMIALATITAMYTQRTLNKGPVRSSNWEKEPLSEQQLDYAASDAHCALIVYERLIEMAREDGIILVPEKYTHGVNWYHIKKKGDPAVSRKPSSTSAPTRASSSSELLQPQRPRPAKSASTGTIKSGTLTATASLGSCDQEMKVDSSSNVWPPKRHHSSSSMSTATIVSTPRITSEAHNAIGEGIQPSAHQRDGNVDLYGEGVMRAPVSGPSWPTLEVQSTLPRSGTAASESEEVPPPKKAKSVPRSASKGTGGVVRQRPQHIRAYNFWHDMKLSVDEMRKRLRSPENPLQVSTVIGYVVGALQADPTLRFNYPQLKILLETDRSSMRRHSKWFGALTESGTAHSNMEGI